MARKIIQMIGAMRPKNTSPGGFSPPRVRRLSAYAGVPEIKAACRKFLDERGYREPSFCSRQDSEAKTHMAEKKLA